MIIVKRANMHFEDKKLFQGSEETGYEVVKDEIYQHMYRIKFPNGEISSTMYNITNAKENCIRELMKKTNTPDPAENTGAPSDLGVGRNALGSSVVRLNEVPATQVAPKKNNAPVVNSKNHD